MVQYKNVNFVLMIVKVVYLLQVARLAQSRNLGCIISPIKDVSVYKNTMIIKLLHA